jgi:hypothetical protein
MNAYWRAANYLSVGQIYLYDNPLLKEPLKLSHAKPLVVGHWARRRARTGPAMLPYGCIRNFRCNHDGSKGKEIPNLGSELVFLLSR